MAISKHAYLFNKVYRDIANRLRDRHNINIANHIDTMEKIEPTLGQGFWFRPVDSGKLKNLLKMPGFAHDNRRNLCDRVAAMATKGQGYRETGAPSLYCQICRESLQHSIWITLALWQLDRTARNITIQTWFNISWMN